MRSNESWRLKGRKEESEISTYYNPLDPKPLKYDDCPPLLQQYINYMLAIKNANKSTVNAYYINIRLFLRFYARLKGIVPEREKIENINIKILTKEQICAATSEDIYAYMYFLTDDRNNKPGVRKQKRTALRSFYQYLAKTEHLIEKNPVDDVEPPSTRGLSSKQPKYLSLDQAKTLLSTTIGQFPSRDYCIIVLLLNCGMRLSELTGINLKDISDDMTTLKLRGKGNKERTTYLNESCQKAITDYLTDRALISGCKNDNALFISREKDRLGQRQIERVVKQRIAAAGLGFTGCTPHSLRHTFATIMLESGVADLPELRDWLGHASTQTTERYTHLKDERLAAVSAAYPLNTAAARTMSIVKTQTDEEKQK